MRGKSEHFILLACLLNVLSGIGIYHARLHEVNFSALSGIFLRILASGIYFYLLPLAWGRTLPRLHSWRGNRDLWLWGFFGLLTLSSYYYAVTMVGAGLTNMINAGSGLVLALLAPLLTKQKSEGGMRWAAAACVVGIFLLSPATLGPDGLFGLGLALLSGLFSALAYTMVARTGTKHTPETILLHWSAINFCVIGLVMCAVPLSWPQLTRTWIVLSIAALMMAAAQYLTARAYQVGNVSSIACLTFFGPLLSLLVDLALFELPFSRWSFLGACLLTTFGLIIPLCKKHSGNASLDAGKTSS